MKLEDVVPAEYSPVLKNKYKKITAENPVFDNIYPSVLADGSIIIERWHNEGIFDESGNIKYYYCIATIKGSGDDTPLSLKDSDLISNTLLKSALLGIIIAIDTKILFINEKAYEILNITAGTRSFEDQQIDQLFKTVFPYNYLEVLGATENTQAENVEIMINTADKARWISVIRKYKLHNQKNTALFLLEDITDRKKTELDIRKAKNNLSKVMRIAKVGYWEKDFKNDCWIWSDELYRIYGIPLNTVITESVLAKYIEPAAMATRHQRMKAVEQTEEDFLSYHIEYPIKSPNSEAKWISGESFFEKAANGSPPRFYGWVQDATTRKQVEQTLRRAKENAEESERLKSAFLANMSHEIRTPLNAILGFSDLLTRTDSVSEQEKFKKIINQSSKLLLKIIDDILDISAIESENFELFFEEITVNKLLAELQDFYSDHEDKNVRLIIQKTDAEAVILVDRERMKQIFINLINNAYKYTNEGTITVTCEKNAVGDHWIFSVKDTGRGIEPEMLNNIFERFYQIDSFSKGTGLGLSISKSLIEQMNGEITAESVPDRGSEFILSLPTN
jgi:signal transduction histidine kinase